MSSAPSAVSVLPPPRSPPIADSTAALASDPFSSSTRTQARRYDMPIDFAAAEIERQGAARRFVAGGSAWRWRGDGEVLRAAIPLYQSFLQRPIDSAAMFPG